MSATHQFKQVQTPSQRVAYEAWTTVTDHFGTHVAISAPTLLSLEVLYKTITGKQEFNAAMAQHTWIIKFEDRSDKSL